ncbi:MAG: hypothetical protein JWN52_513 [Actinomycetia bacterium]|nr:hypothetical protein [Actinomycetes bacterium]
MTTDPYELEKLDEESATAGALELLVARGAGEIAHPGGTLLAHLRRVHTLLEQWGARPAVRLAGLSHAFYGTDGFRTALGDVIHRQELAAVIGQEAEQLVYFYAGCDRSFSYPRLTEDEGPFKDRFTDTLLRPPLRLRRDFAEITVANELDIVCINPELRARHGQELLNLFTAWLGLLSDPARQSIEATLT